MDNVIRCELPFAKGVSGDPCNAQEILRVGEERTRDTI